jgi:hypothetical protein
VIAYWKYPSKKEAPGMNENKTSPKNTYRIRIKGVPNHSLTDWLADVQVIPQEQGETLLVGQFADQPALRGLLDQLWNLNYTVLSVERIENERPK